MPESFSEIERFENGVVPHDLEIPLALAAAQGLLLWEEEDGERELPESTA